MNHNPVATYRLQLRPGFGFDQVSEKTEYLSKLGISHIYASPYLQAAEGSTHGYDVVDPAKVNKELGGEEAHIRMCETIQNKGLGQMLDIVPNHMSIGSGENPWWWDVLENGPSSRYAAYFDVDWEASEERWPNKVLLPVLGDHYGRVLENGELKLSYEKGKFKLYYYDQIFPVDLSSIAGLLGRVAESCGSEILSFLAESHSRLPRPTVTARKLLERRHRDKAVLQKMLADLCWNYHDIYEEVMQEIERVNQNPDALDEILDQQNYRLAFWRTASRDLGYRRFFDIKDLAGLRVEDPEVFEASHRLPVEWVKKGWIQGLRIDHPDGLRDPAGYFKRLRESCPDAWIVAEKILEPGERLPLDWPIEGTTGYDFLNLQSGLFIDPKGEYALSKVYADFTDKEHDLKEMIIQAKRKVLTEILVSELNRLTDLLVKICEQHRRYRDYSRFELKEALTEISVRFPVYRSYVTAKDGNITEDDIYYIDEAVEKSLENREDLDPELFEFIRDILQLRIEGELEGELVMRFQQLSGPAMAKGVEDTVFYRYHRLTALNEVGGDPSRFGILLSRFHDACETNQKEYPLSLLASTTHDTKRSEDVRSRLAVLSEIPKKWGEVVKKWSAMNEQYKSEEGFPDKNTEYLIYQTLTGAWPLSEDRLKAYMEKAVREAKEFTSWTDQDETYEKALFDFIHSVLNDEPFIKELKEFVELIMEAGRLNSLSQTLIKLTAPGVPDIYQGTELWDLSLVDPDNRRPVDFGLREEMLEKSDHLSPEEILNEMDSGLPKLYLIAKVLRYRREHPEIFGDEGDYIPLFAEGKKSDHVVAFSRNGSAVTVAPCLNYSLNGDWGATSLDLPEGSWVNLMTGEPVKGESVKMKSILGRFPVAFLVKEEKSGETE